MCLEVSIKLLGIKWLSLKDFSNGIPYQNPWILLSGFS